MDFIYTIRGSQQLDERIAIDLKQIVDAIRHMPEAKQWVAIILCGGYGRGEGTPLICEGQELPFNDYDLIVVSTKNCFWTRKVLQKKLHALAEDLTQKLEIEVDIDLRPIDSLSSAEFTLMNCELKYGHRVLWGPQDVLFPMPSYLQDKVPLLEGTRLLLNRGALLLHNRQMVDHSNEFTREGHLRFLKYIFKVYLALGDCLLLKSGKYSSESSNKRKRIEEIGYDVNSPSQEWVIAKYKEAIDFKEWADLGRYKHYNLGEAFREVREEFLTFFLWYEQERLGKIIDSPSGYCTLLQTNRESYPSPLKSSCMNLLFFKNYAWHPGIKWLWIYPRFRLFPSLWILLKNSISDEEQRLLQDLLGGKDDYLNRFFSLQGHFG